MKKSDVPNQQNDIGKEEQEAEEEEEDLERLEQLNDSAARRQTMPPNATHPGTYKYHFGGGFGTESSN